MVFRFLSMYILQILQFGTFYGYGLHANGAQRILSSTMHDDQFTKLFKYMERGFKELSDTMNAGFVENKTQHDSLFGLLDTIAKAQVISEEERLVFGHQLERLDSWIHQLAAKVGINLTA